MITLDLRIHVQIPLTGHVGFIMQSNCGYCKLEWLLGYAKGKIQLLHCEVAPVGVTEADPSDTTTFSSHAILRPI